MQKRSHRAFTIVELLVVVGIFTILISLLMPALSKARRFAAQLSCASTLRQLQSLNEVYASQNRGWYLPILQQKPDGTALYSWPQDPALRDFMGFPQSPGFYMGGGAQRSMICREAELAQTFALGDGLVPIGYSYGMNFTDFYDPTDRSMWYQGFPAAIPPVPPKAAVCYKQNWIKNSSEKLSWADSIGYSVRESTSNVYYAEVAASAGIAYRHSQGVNIAFFDGHVEWLHRNKVDKNILPVAAADKLWYACR